MSKSVITYVEVPLSSFPDGAELVPKITRLPGAMGKAAFRVTITAKEKRYVLPMPDGLVGESQCAMRIAIRDKDEGWYGSTYHYDVAALETPSYTQADIDAAPAWVQAIKPVEVTDHD